MSAAENPKQSFMQREGGALICIVSIFAIQLLLVVNVLYFTDSRATPDIQAAPVLRPSINP